MTTKEVIRYEDAAERRTVEGWVCKKCGRLYEERFHDAEHMARWCCATELPCDCGGRNDCKSYTCCQACRDKHDDERFAAMEEVDWDGETPVCTWGSDKFFFDAESITDWIDDDEERSLEKLQLVLCKKHKPREFEVGEFLCDDLGEEGSDALGPTVEIDAIVNKWIAENAPTMWDPTNKRISLASLKAHGVERTD